MRHFNWRYLLRKRCFRALTGIEPAHFLDTIEALRPVWQRRVVDRKNRSGRPWSVGGLEDHLLVLLILYRCAVTQDFMGCLYGVDKAVICRALKRIEPVARRVIGVKRSIRVTAEEAEALIIDATEQPILRPSRKQRCWYSGKKKRHVIKAEITVTAPGRIAGRSQSVPGRVHDMELRRRGPPLPANARIYADSGYQGLQNEHPTTEVPFKRSKGNRLTPDEREYNRALGSFRVGVEHAIAKIKRFRMMSDRFRYPRHTHSSKFGITAGLVNIISGF
jgi:IS5 family transposase